MWNNMLDGKFKGDTIHVYKRVSFDLTGYKIRAEVFDISGRSLKLANTAAGGSDAQIKITDALKGRFIVTIPSETLYYWNDKSWLEIQIEGSSGQIWTIDKEFLHIAYRKINWQSPS